MNTYEIAAYGAMIADSRRFGAYREALQRCVHSHATVLDLGAGTGIFALLACRFGAAHVYAIEAGDVIQVAREIAVANGLGDRISFFHDPSSRVTLPERVDVIVSDLRGALPLYGDHIPSIIDARRRFLKPGGRLIPRCDEIWVAPVESNEIYGELVSPWEATEVDLDMSAARRLVTHLVHPRRVAADRLLADGQRWATIDYTSVDSADAGADVDFAIEREGILHGFILWFDSVLTEGVSLSNAPEETELIYGGVFLPLAEPVEMRSADRVSLGLNARVIGRDYMWRWITGVVGRDGVERRRFSQSTFLGMPLSKGTLSRAAVDATPELSCDGNIDRDALALMDGKRSLADIAQLIFERYPQAFESRRAALDRVVALALHYAG